MICEKCKKKYDRPLELYNGDWACPHCHRLLRPAPIAPLVTDENDELFRLSEICYHTALTQSGGQKSIYDRQLRTALDLCKRAAQAGNPKALVRYGYYYEKGYLAVNEEEAFKMATQYYRMVWDGAPVEAAGYTPPLGCDNDYADGGKAVKSAAARQYLQLLLSAPERFARYLHYEEDRDAILRKGLSVSVNEDAQTAGGSEDNVSRAADALHACLGKARVPLFGVFRLSGSEFDRLTGVTQTKGKTRYRLIDYIERGRISVFMVRLTAATPSQKDLVEVKNRAAFEHIKEDNYCLFFFNGNHGRHRLRNADGILRRLKADGYDMLLNYVSAAKNNGCDYVFYDDDVLVNKSGMESAVRGAQNLLEKVMKEGEETV